MPNIPVPADATGLPAFNLVSALRRGFDHVPHGGAPTACGDIPTHGPTPVEEFVTLMDQRKRIDLRLDEPVVIMNPMPGDVRRGGALAANRRHMAAVDPTTLPQSGLALSGSLPGSALYKGGCRHG